MLSLLLQEHGEGHGGGHEGGGHHAPHSIFTKIWESVSHTELGHWYGFDNPLLGQFWFDAIGFSIIGAAVLIICASMATQQYNRVPRGIQNVFEWVVGLLRGMVHGFIPGAQGDRYLPYLGSLFLFIFTMNMLGVIPGFRSPTMTLSTTAAMGLTTIVMVQAYAIRDTGLGSYLKHFTAGTAFPLMLLMIPVEIIGELAKPMSLSLRLFGNIFGEDNVIEQLMSLGGWIPVQLPMLLLALFTSFLQAFIFTTLSTIYIASKVVHEGGHDEEHGHGDEHHDEKHAAHDAHHH
jgi:F-type H+-transporting ATPase subunit a